MLKLKSCLPQSRIWRAPLMIAAVGLVSSCASSALPAKLPSGNDYMVAQGTQHQDDFGANQLGNASGLRPGDTIDISFPNAPELNSSQLVQPSGVISTPYIGNVYVVGRSTSEVATELQDGYRPILKNPVVSVTLAALGTPILEPEIFVIGAVENPGAIPLNRSLTSVHAIALAGGPSNEAAQQRIAVIRRNADSYVATIYDYRSALQGRSQYGASAFSPLLDGDIVFVPRSNLSRVAEIAEQVRSVIGFRADISFRFPRDN